MMKLALVFYAWMLAAGAANAAITATQHAEQEIVTRGPSGEETISRVPADKVVPGEEVIYLLRFANDAEEAAEAVVLVMPVPGEVAFVEGSVLGEDANVTFSADGGQTYVARGRLTVAEGGIERPARSNEITHIKWSLSKPLAPRQTGEISFRAVLK